MVVLTPKPCRGDRLVYPGRGLMEDEPMPLDGGRVPTDDALVPTDDAWVPTDDAWVPTDDA